MDRTAQGDPATPSMARSLVRRVRKHRVVWLCVITLNLVLFFPVLFMNRLVSPADILQTNDPWSYGEGRVQNPLLTEPATTTLPLVSAFQKAHSLLHWNRFSGSGTAGAGAFLMSPFFLIPALFFPLAWFFTVAVFLKLNTALFFAYRWLREEGQGKGGSAFGAVVVAGSGVCAVWWLWNLTNATALLPGLFWLIRRATRGMPVPPLLSVLLIASFLTAGFLPAILWGACLAGAYLLVQTRGKGSRLKAGGELAVMWGIAALIVAPFLTATARVSRVATLAAPDAIAFPFSQLMSFLTPQRLGNPATQNWTGGAAIPSNFIEATIYLGAVTVPFVILGLFRRGGRSRWFWITTLAVVLAVLFGGQHISQATSILTQKLGAPVNRLAMFLPLAAGYLAASGWTLLARIRPRAGVFSRRAMTFVLVLFALINAWDLGLFAGRFLPFIEETGLRSSQTLDYLSRERGSFRIAPFFGYLPPNSSALLGLEDVRSRSAVDPAYRKLLERIDPSVRDNARVIQFNGLHFNPTDPLLSMLNVRFLIEPPPIDIVRWGIYGATVPGVPLEGSLPMRSGRYFERLIHVNEEPFWACEIPVQFERGFARDSHLTFTLIRPETGEIVRRVSYPSSELEKMEKIYIPVHPFGRRGNALLLRIESFGVSARIAAAEPVRGETPFFYGRVKTPLILLRELEDGRIFENLAVLPRYYPVSRIEKFSDSKLLDNPKWDFSEAAVVSGDVGQQYSGTTDATVRLVVDGPAETTLETQATRPFFLASSEKLDDDLSVSVDGKTIAAVKINTLFAGVPLAAGGHRVTFTRKIGRRWWPAVWSGVLLLAVVAELERQRFSRRNNATSERGLRKVF